jgi:Zn-dependent protease
VWARCRGATWGGWRNLVSFGGGLRPSFSVMVSSQSGAFRLFRFSGIEVHLHWTWFLAAWYFIGQASGEYSSVGWNIAEYVSLFVIVLMHEFGHAFAARQVGGESKEIILWPFGGIAFAKVPPRPAAELWAIVAGPLVNVVLYPVLYWIAVIVFKLGWAEENPDLRRFLSEVFQINLSLLLFNILPIYPLDGGQTLRSLLWFKLGRAQSLRIATIIGFVAIPCGVLWLYSKGWLTLFTGMIAAFLAMECLRGFKQTALLKKLSALPRHNGFACPTCRERPPGGPMWGCSSCQHGFDPFSTRAVCPHCTTVMVKVPCPYCGSAHAIEQWDAAPPRRPGDPPVIEV